MACQTLLANHNQAIREKIGSEKTIHDPLVLPFSQF